LAISTFLNFGEVPMPSPKSGDVLIKIEAVGTNYYDTLVRSGAVSRSIQLPHVVGSDVVGHIEKLGDEVKTLRLGDRVIVAPGFPCDPNEWDITPENEAPSYHRDLCMGRLCPIHASAGAVGDPG
jgi:NADPH:quinone reductase-like Zn-dependent oxidoreductase